MIDTKFETVQNLSSIKLNLLFYLKNKEIFNNLF